MVDFGLTSVGRPIDLPKIQPVVAPQAPEQPKASWLNLFARGVRENTIPGAAVKSAASRKNANVDLAFNPRAASIDRGYTKAGYSEDQLDYLDTARSGSHYDLIQKEIEDTNKYFQDLSNAGIFTTLTSVGLSGLVDPTILVAGLAEAKALTMSFKASMVVAGLGNIAQEAVIDHLTNNRTSLDYVMAATAPTAFAGGAYAVKALGRGTAKSVMKSADAIDSAINKMHTDVQSLRIKEATNSTSVGAAQLRDVSRKGKKYTTFTKYMGSDFKRLVTAGTKEVREYADKFLSDAAGDGGTTVRNRSAALTSRTEGNELLTSIMPEYDRLKRSYMKDSSFGEDDFERALYLELNARQMGDNINDNPHISAAADAWENTRRLEHSKGSKAGVDRYDGTEVDPNYVKQKVNNTLVGDWVSRGKRNQLIEGLAKSIESASTSKQLEDTSIFKKYATALVDRATEESKGKSTQGLTILPDSVDWFKKKLADQGVDEEGIESLLKILTPDNKKVIRFDMAYEIQKGVRVIDFFDTDLRGSIHAEMKTLGGDLGMASQGIKSDLQWDAMVNKLLDVHRGDKIVHKELKEMTDMHRKLLRGHPTEANPGDLGSVMGRRVREFLGAVSLNQMLFPQFAETARVIGSVGLRDFSENFPGLKGFQRDLMGKHKNELLSNFEECGLGVGNQHIIDALDLRTDDAMSGKVSGMWSKFDTGMAWTRKAQGKWTGMDFIMANQQALAVTGISNKLFKLAKNTKEVKPPQRVFHRTTVKGIKEMKKVGVSTHSFAGTEGFYFSKTIDEPSAQIFGKQVVTADVNVKNPAPLTIMGTGGGRRVRANIKLSSQEFNTFIKSGGGGIIASPKGKTPTFSGPSVPLSTDPPKEIRKYFNDHDVYKAVDPERISKSDAELLESRGYDGMDWEGHDSVAAPAQVVALRPEQIEVVDPTAPIKTSKIYFEIPADFTKRLRDMSLSDQDVKDILVQMKKHGEVDPDSRTGISKNLHVDRWDDQRLWDSYKTAMVQYTAQVIQADLVGETHMWFGTTLGKVMTQFRKFPIVALEKQLIHDIRFKDKEAVKTFAYALGMSTAAYIAKVELNSVGRPDAEAYREKAFSPERMWYGSIGYVGQLSFLPDAVKTIVGVATGDTSSTSRAGTSLFPAMGLPKKIGQGVVGIRKLALPSMAGVDNDATYQDFQNTMGLTGVNNILFLKNFFNFMGTAVEKAKE